MRSLIAYGCAAMVLLLTGCAGTDAVVKSQYQLTPADKVRLQLNVPPGTNPEGVVILSERLNGNLTASGLLAAAPDKTPKLLEVVVTNYRLRHGAARALVGIFAGTDNVTSTVRVKDANGRVLSEYVVSSDNPTAWGTSRGLLEEHADKIVSVLKGGK